MVVTTTNEPTVLVIDSEADRATTLKNMIEFLDTPAVAVAGVDEWQSIAEQICVSAVFLGSGLNADTAGVISRQLQQQLPDIPVVVVDEHHDRNT
ncbi:MAG: hypothetical protein AAF004_12050 [Pseudomonadota bacterium]